MTIGRIRRVPLREVWPHEAHDFTTWLRDNIEVLGETLGLELTGAESERAAGSFSVDIVAEDVGGRTVVIENQLGKSDHDHLGKVITYLTSFDAVAAIWIVGDARPEHVQAVAWLNESSSADFYLAKVEAIRIGESDAAPLVTLIVGPSEEAKEIGRQKEEMAEQDLIRHEFWTGLLIEAKDHVPMFANISPSKGSWTSTSSIPYGGMTLNFTTRMHDTGGHIYIDSGPGTEEQIRSVYDALQADRDEIEARYGGGLEWTPPNGRRSARVAFKVDHGGHRDRERWQEIHEATVAAMVRFWDALTPSLDRIFGG